MTLIQSILNKPDLYLEELKQELIQAIGADVSLSTICRTLKRLSFSRNKLDTLHYREVRKDCWNS